MVRLSFSELKQQRTTEVEGKSEEGEPRVSLSWCVMGCFGSQSSKASQDDSKNQKRRSDAITRHCKRISNFTELLTDFFCSERESLGRVPSSNR